MNERHIQSMDYVKPSNVRKKPEQNTDPQTVARPSSTPKSSTTRSRVSPSASQESGHSRAWAIPKKETRIPRVAALMAGLSRPRQRLLKAVEKCDKDKALKMLRDEVSVRLLNQKTLDDTLWSVFDGASDKLIDKLLEQGANNDSIKAEETILIHVLHLKGL